MPSIKEDARRRLEISARRLVRIMRLDAPDSVVAREIRLILASGFLYCGQDLAGQFLECMQEDQRRRTGFCQHCDTQLPPFTCQTPTCEQCEAKADAECRRIDEMLADYHDDGSCPEGDDEE